MLRRGYYIEGRVMDRAFSGRIGQVSTMSWEREGRKDLGESVLRLRGYIVGRAYRPGLNHVLEERLVGGWVGGLSG